MSNAAQLNQFLFETLQGVKDGTVDAEKAKSITGIAQTMINNARAEIDFAKVIGNVEAPILLNKPCRHLPTKSNQTKWHKHNQKPAKSTEKPSPKWATLPPLQQSKNQDKAGETA